MALLLSSLSTRIKEIFRIYPRDPPLCSVPGRTIQDRSHDGEPIPHDSAAEKVFDIPELLELILLQTRPRDIVVFQRISKTWQATIRASPKLGTLLRCRHHKPADHRQLMVFASDDLELLNATLDVKNLILEESDQPRITESIPSVEISCSALITETYNGLNPLLSNIDGRPNGYIFAMETKQLKAYRKKTVWKNMSVTSPAVTDVRVHLIPDKLKQERQRCLNTLADPLLTEKWHHRIRLFYTRISWIPPFAFKRWWQVPMSKSSAPGSGTLINENGVAVADLAKFVKNKWKREKAERYYFAFMNVQ